MAGKNKIEPSFRIAFDDSGATLRDLSADYIPGSISGLGLTAEAVDMHGGSEGTKTVLAGYTSSEISAKFHASNAATIGAYTVLVAGGTFYSGTLTCKFGSSGAAPTTGDFQFSGEFVLLDASIAMESGRAVISAKWQPLSGASAPAWSTI